MLFDPFYGVYGTSTKVAHFLNRVVIVAEYGILATLIVFFATGDGLSAWGWVGLCGGGVLAIQVINLVLRFLWNVFLTFIYGTTDADEIAEAHDRRLRERQLREEERLRRIEEAEVRKAQKNREVIEKEWDDDHASFE